MTHQIPIPERALEEEEEEEDIYRDMDARSVQLRQPISLSALDFVPLCSDHIKPPLNELDHMERRSLRGKSPSSSSSMKGFLVALSVFSLYLSVIVFYATFILPKEDVFDKFYIPTSIEEAREFTRIFTDYVQAEWVHALIGFALVYSFVHCFCIPGGFLLNVCAGALFGFRVGFLLCIVTASVGVSMTYGAVYMGGKHFVYLCCVTQIETLAYKISNRRGRLFGYLLLMRVFPLVPNFLINLGAPILRIPFGIFYTTALLGFIPQTMLSVRLGLTLMDIDFGGGGDAYDKDPHAVGSFVVIQLVVLVIGLFTFCLLPFIPCVRRRLER